MQRLTPKKSAPQLAQTAASTAGTSKTSASPLSPTSKLPGTSSGASPLLKKRQSFASAGPGGGGSSSSGGRPWLFGLKLGSLGSSSSSSSSSASTSRDEPVADSGKAKPSSDRTLAAAVAAAAATAEATTAVAAVQFKDVVCEAKVFQHDEADDDAATLSGTTAVSLPRPPVDRVHQIQPQQQQQQQSDVMRKTLFPHATASAGHASDLSQSQPVQPVQTSLAIKVPHHDDAGVLAAELPFSPRRTLARSPPPPTPPTLQPLQPVQPVQPIQPIQQQQADSRPQSASPTRSRSPSPVSRSPLRGKTSKAQMGAGPPSSVVYLASAMGRDTPESDYPVQRPGSHGRHSPVQQHQHQQHQQHRQQEQYVVIHSTADLTAHQAQFEQVDEPDGPRESPGRHALQHEQQRQSPVHAVRHEMMGSAVPDYQHQHHPRQSPHEHHEHHEQHGQHEQHDQQHKQYEPPMHTDQRSSSAVPLRAPHGSFSDRGHGTAPSVAVYAGGATSPTGRQGRSTADHGPTSFYTHANTSREAAVAVAAFSDGMRASQGPRTTETAWTETTWQAAETSMNTSMSMNTYAGDHPHHAQLRQVREQYEQRARVQQSEHASIVSDLHFHLSEARASLASATDEAARLAGDNRALRLANQELAVQVRLATDEVRAVHAQMDALADRLEDEAAARVRAEDEMRGAVERGRVLGHRVEDLALENDALKKLVRKMQYETSDVMRGRLDQALYDNESLHMMVKDLRSEVDGLQRATTPGTPGLTHGTPLGMRRDSIVTGGSVGSVGMDAAGRPPSSSVRGRLLERRRVSEAGDTLLSARAADSVMGLDELQSPRPVSMGAMLSPPPPAAASLTGTSPVGVRPLSMMTSSLGVQYDDHAHAHHRSQSTSGVQARHGSLNAAAAMGATGPGAGAGGAHHARGQTVSYAVADERRGEDVHGWTSDDGGDHLQRREALDAQLRVLSDEKSQLSFELSRVPASGGKNRQRLAELESQLDVVDKKMAAVRRRMRDMGAI